jgi:hypothetical protein
MYNIEFAETDINALILENQKADKERKYQEVRRKTGLI